MMEVCWLVGLVAILSGFVELLNVRALLMLVGYVADGCGHTHTQIDMDRGGGVENSSPGIEVYLFEG